MNIHELQLGDLVYYQPFGTCIITSIAEDCIGICKYKTSRIVGETVYVNNLDITPIEIDDNFISKNFNRFTTYRGAGYACTDWGDYHLELNSIYRNDKFTIRKGKAWTVLVVAKGIKYVHLMQHVCRLAKIDEEFIDFNL